MKNKFKDLILSKIPNTWIEEGSIFNGEVEGVSPLFIEYKITKGLFKTTLSVRVYDDFTNEVYQDLWALFVLARLHRLKEDARSAEVESYFEKYIESMKYLFHTMSILTNTQW